MTNQSVSVFGLGYVGTVSALCLADDGHNIVGVDPNSVKVDMINEGRAPIVEAGVPELLTKMRGLDRIVATSDSKKAVLDTSISLICVGTPSRSDGSLDISYVKQVCEQIGEVLKEKDHHTVVVRSTVLPGTTVNVLLPLLEATSGKKCGDGFHLCFNPEFLREGTAVDDYRNPPKTVIGEAYPGSGKVLEDMYAAIDAPLIKTKLKIAEMVKYSDNAWHALKVVFANEIGSLSKSVGVDGQDVMDIFCSDLKLNLSEKYLRPGFAFGGSCLPKDVRALVNFGRAAGLEIPLLEAVLPANSAHLSRSLQLILSQGRMKVGFLGLSFKAGTDDLRESPQVYLVEQLLGKGYHVSIYDRNVKYSSLMGANKDYITEYIPHIAELISDDLLKVVQTSELLVLGNSSTDFDVLRPEDLEDKVVVDLVRIDSVLNSNSYSGICW